MTTDDMVIDVSQDWVLASHIQQGFMRLPGSNPSSTNYGARCRQLCALGGDCFDFMPLTDNHLALVVGDASGKGMAAALMIAKIQSSLQTAALFAGNSLASLFKVVNLQTYTSTPDNQYATLFYGVFDSATRTLQYVNAGHNPPVILRADGSIEWLELGGPPIGMFPDASYKTNFHQLNPGDLLIAYTDGVVETTNPKGEEWGVRGLLRAATDFEPHGASVTDLVESIFDSMDHFSNDSQTDDATVAVLRVA